MAGSQPSPLLQSHASQSGHMQLQCTHRTQDEFIEQTKDIFLKELQ